MPSTSDKQRRFMAAAAHNPSFASKAGIPQEVAMEYNQADKQKKQAMALRKHNPDGMMNHNSKGMMSHNPGYAHASPNGTMSYSSKPTKKTSASNQGGAAVGGGT